MTLQYAIALEQGIKRYAYVSCTLIQPNSAAIRYSSEEVALRAIPSLLIQPLIVQPYTRLASRWGWCPGCGTARTVSKQAAAHRASSIAQAL